MSIQYHHIEPDNYADYGITKKPKLGVSFIRGVPITTPLPNPLVFEIDYPDGSVLPHFLGDTIPVFSDRLVQTLRSAGVDNFQVFSAILRNPTTGIEWTDYWAFNAVGLVAAAKLEESDFDTLMGDDPEGVDVPLLAFNNLVLDKKKTRKLLMFRLTQSPSTLLIHDKVNIHIDANRPPEGWNFDATAIDTV